MERAAFERRWKAEEVEYRKRIARHLEEVREDVQQQLEGLHIQLQQHHHSHHHPTQPAPSLTSPPEPPPPPPPPPPPVVEASSFPSTSLLSSSLSSLQTEVESLRSSLHAALTSLRSEREERLLLAQRFQSMEASMERRFSEMSDKADRKEWMDESRLLQRRMGEADVAVKEGMREVDFRLARISRDLQEERRAREEDNRQRKMAEKLPVSRDSLTLFGEVPAPAQQCPPQLQQLSHLPVEVTELSPSTYHSQTEPLPASARVEVALATGISSKSSPLPSPAPAPPLYPL